MGRARTRGRTFMALAAVMVSISAPFIAVGPAFAGVAFSVPPTFPALVTVGQTGLPATLEIKNGSTVPENGAPVTLSTITLVPTCGTNLAAIDCPAGFVDPGVFQLSSTGVGEAGTVCAGVSFAIAIVDPAQGKYSFTPATTVVLQPPGSAGDTCRIDFTFTVLKVPTKDVAPGTPGVQTAQLGFAGGNSNLNANFGTGTGISLVTVNAATPAVATLASASTVNVSQSFTDTATVTGVTNGPTPTGTVTFAYVFDPAGTAACSGVTTPIGPAPLSPVAPPTVPPSATATSGAVTATAPGIYHFIATYGGDANYTALPTTPCGAAGENVMAVAMPTLATVASSSNPAAPPGTATVPETVTDKATVTGVTGGPAPTGTVTFTRFFDAPGAAPCSGPSATVGPLGLTPVAPATIPPSSTASTPAFAPTGPGTVRFVATYNGDPTYTAVTSVCGAAGENVVVQAPPGFATVASSSNPAAPAGTATTADTVSDTATVTGSAGGPVPSGTVTFTRFFDAPGAAPCSGPGTPIGPVVLTPAAPATIPPSATASTPGFAPPGPGTVRFVASYSGDANYTAVPNSACGAAGENVTVTAMPVLATFAASSNPADPAGTAGPGATIADTATVTGVTGGPAPAGTVTFTRFLDAPGAAPCSGPAVIVGPVGLATVAPATIPPSSTASTPAFAPPTPGTVRFIASYSGDANYSGLPNSACGAPGENVTAQAAPALATLAASSNPAAPTGTATTADTVSDKATVTGVTGGPAPTGTVTFTRFFDAPGAAPCSSAAAVLAPVTLTTAAPATTPPSSTASTPPFAPPGPGTVRFVASFSGDAAYTALPNTACGAPGENVTVTAMPTLATLAASSNPADPAGTAGPGATVADRATVTGVTGGPAPAGTVTFTRFFDAPGAAPCSGPATTVGPLAVNPVAPATTPPSSSATTPAFTPSGPGTVRFLARYSGDGAYAALPDTACGDPGENVTVSALPALATLAASSNPADPAGTAGPGATVSDRATVTGVTGGPAPAGTVTFTRFFDAPGAAPCSSAGTVLAAVTLNPVAPATTPPSSTASTPAFTPPGPGTVRFLASYSGDVAYTSLPNTACGAPGENVTAQAAPALSTLATSSNPANPAGTAGPGATVADTATVTGVTAGPAPTGTVTFTRFFDAPGAAPCSGPSTQVGPLTLAPVAPAPTPPASTVTTPAFAPPGPGTARFVASYSGDVFYASLPNSACGAAGENVTVTVGPSLVTVASSSDSTRPAGTAALGDSVSDIATVTGAAGAPAPTGTVTFTRYFDAPGAALCSGTATVLAPVSLTAVTPATTPPSSRATSPAFTPTGPGTVRFLASYSGDGLYAPVPNTACGTAGENVVVPKSPSGIVTDASIAAGNAVSDKAVVQGFNPTGTVLFQLYRDDNTCTSAPVFSNTKTLVTSAGVTSATTDPFVLPGAGIYRFVATYSGDANNDPSGPTSCLDARETLGVGVLPVQLSTDASDPVSVNQPIFDTATFAATVAPTGVITFNLYGPDIADCSGVPIFSSNKIVTGNGTYVSGSFSPTRPGTYRWVATYSGDASNAAFSTPCNDPLEQVVVSPLPTIGVVKTATPPDLPVPGGTFTFPVVVTNTGTIPITITSLTDDKYGDVTRIPGSTCNTAIGTVLAPGQTYSCSFTGLFNGPAGATQTDIVTVTGVDVRNNTVRASDDAIVTITPLPTIAVVKTATPLSLPVPGGTFTFPVVVTNTSNVPLTIRTLTDDVYGDVTKIPGSTCANAIGVILAPSPGPGNTYSCSFPGNFTGPAGASQTDIVTVTAIDNRNTTVQASDDAIVRITPLPMITTTKTPSPNSLPEPGGTFTFGYSVTNTGPEAVTITSIVDDVYGDLNGRGTCTIGARLEPAATYRCTFSGNFFGNAGAAQTDTITTTARDDRGQTVQSQSQAVVRITDVPPSIRVEKSPNPVSRPEPGGTFRFTVTVVNTSFEPVIIVSLVDDVYGDLNGKGSCAVGVRLAANGGSYSCAFDGDFRGKAGDSQTDTVTAGAVDDEGTRVTALARATVFLTPAGTPIVVPPVVVPPVVQTPQVLVRTGSNVSGPARLAGFLLLAGMTLIVATRNFGDGGPGLAPVPAGPGGGGGPGGPGSGGRGHWFGDDNWFGGARVHPPRGPMGGLGAEAPPAPPVPEDAQSAWDLLVRPETRVAPATEPMTEPEPEHVPQAEVVAPAAEVGPVQSGLAPPVVAQPEPVPVEAVVARLVIEPRPEVIVPTVVSVRATGALDGAALDAAQALSAPARTQGAPAGRRRGRKPGRS